MKNPLNLFHYPRFCASSYREVKSLLSNRFFTVDCPLISVAYAEESEQMIDMTVICRHIRLRTYVSAQKVPYVVVVVVR